MVRREMGPGSAVQGSVGYEIVGIAKDLGSIIV
jgi:hypothetical protein